MANEFIIRKGYKSLSSSEITGSLNVSAETYTTDVFINGHGSVSASLSSIVANDLDGSGTANYISKFSDTDTLTDSSISDDGSTINIFANTTGNTGVVNIFGEGGVPPTLQVSSRTNRAKLKIADNDTAINIIAEGSIGSFGFGSTSSATNNISILSTGRVGIGVIASTNAMLDVRGPDTDNAVLGRFWSNTGARGSFIIRNGTNVSPTTFIGTAGGSEQLSIGTNNTEAIRIDASQKVGIGTTNPLHPLHVVGIISGSDTYINGWNSVSGSLYNITTTHTAFSASVSTRFEGLTTDYTELDNIPDNIISSSAQIASDISGSITSFSGSITGRVETNESSIASLNGATGSYLLNTTDTLTGNLTVTGTLTAQEFHTEFVSASILFDSGSTKFGDSSDDKHSFTGSLQISGSGITIKDPGTPVINLIDETNDLSLKFRSANNYGYIDLDAGNSVGSSRLLLRTDGYPFLYGNQNHDVYIPSGSLVIGTETLTGKFNSYISATRQLTHNGNGGDLSIISDNNTAPVLFVKGTGTADLVNIYDNTTEVFTILDGGNVGIGTTSPSAKLQVTGTSGYVLKTNGDIALTTYTGDTKIDMANNSLQLLSPSGNVQIGDTESDGNGTSIQVDDANSKVVIAGNVGIGTSNPTFGTGGGLQITNASQANLRFTDSSASTFITDLALSNENFYIINRSASGQLKFRVNASTEAMTIVSTGNIGIGTSSPGNNLHVYKNATIGTIASPTVANASFRIQDSGANMYVDGNSFVIDTSGYLTTTGSNDFDIGTNSTSRIKIKGGGNVGIGATDPLRKLHVVGNFAVNATTTQYYGVYITGGEGANPNILIGDWHNSSANISWNSSGNYLRIDAQHSTSGAPIVFSGNDSAIEYMRITSAGKVGIGTSAPTTKFEIIGDGTGNSGIGFKQSGAQEHRLYAANQTQHNAIGSSAPIWKWGQSDATGSISSQKMLLNNSGLTVTGDIDSDDITIDGWGSVSSSLASIATAGGVNGSGTTNDLVMWSGANSLSDAPIAISGNNATFAGTIHLDNDSSQLQFGDDNDMQIYHNGANGEINNATGNFTIDSANAIILDADIGGIQLMDGGTKYGTFGKNNEDFHITANRQDGDMKFFGNDNGSSVTALRLDMSDQGWAHFNTGIQVGNSAATSTFAGNISATTFSGNVTGGTISGTTGTFTGNVQTSKLQLSSDTEHFVSFSTTSLINTGTTVDTTGISGRRIDLYAYDDIKLRAGTSDSIYLMSGGSDTLTLDSNSNATFTGVVSVASGKSFRLYNAAGNGWGELTLNETDNKIQFNRGIQPSGDNQSDQLLGTASKRWHTLNAGAADITGQLKWASTNASSYTYSNADASGLYIETVGSTAALSDMRFQARAAGTGNYSYIKIKPSNQSILLGTNAANRLTIDSSGDSKFSGNIETEKNVYQDIGARGGYIMRPWGADYLNSTTNVHTGAIKIILPTTGTMDDMLKFTLDIYQYQADESTSIDIAGYIYQSPGNNTWLNCTTIVHAKDATENYTVRYGDDGTNHCVWIGELNSTWNHPQIIVRNFFGGFLTDTDQYLGEWDIAFEATAFTNVNTTQSNNFPLSSGGVDGAFLPLTAGGTKPLVGDLYINSSLYFGGANERIYMNGGGSTNWRGVEVNSTGMWSWGETGTNNYFAKKVGIGTSNPANMLHVHSTGNGAAALILEDDARRLEMGRDQIVAKTADGSSVANLYLQPSGDTSLASNSGGVGIGTTSPQYKLQVDAGSNIASFRSVGTGQNDKELLIHTGGDRVVLDSRTASDSSAASLALELGTSEKVRLTTTGLGIGTSIPGYPLSLENSGTGLISRIFNTNADGQGLLIRAGATTSTTRAFQVASSNDTKIMTVNSNGRVGIGTTNPGTKLYVDSGQSTFNRGNSAGTIATFRGQNTEKAVIGTAQSYFLSNVGIGTTANTKIDLAGIEPRLHVLGDSTTGAYNLVASFQSGGDANDTGAAIRIHHANDRGLLIKAGRADSDREVAYLDLVSSGGTETNMLTLRKVGSQHNVGIGTTSPSKKFNIVGHSGTDVIQSVRNPNTSWSQYALTRYGTEADDFRYMDFGYFRGTTEATRGLVIQSQANANLVTFLDTGNVGIGTTNPSNKLDVRGTGTVARFVSNSGYVDQIMVNSGATNFLNFTGSTFNLYNNGGSASNVTLSITPTEATFTGNVTVEGALTETSARRFKDNIKTLDKQISNISKLNPVTFDWKKDGKSDIGFIAEEVKEVYPNLVSEENGEIKGVQYTKLTAILVKALQDQQKQIDELKEEIFILKKK